jgi:hypothetical protein
VPHVFRGRFVAIMTIQQKEGILVSDCEVQFNFYSIQPDENFVEL